MNIEGQIESKLKHLRLTGMLETLAVRLSQAEESRGGYLDFLMTLVEDEYERRQSRFLLGPVGVGKTHLAQALGHIACRMGYEVLFAKAVKMFRYLNGGRADNSLESRIKEYTSVQLLIIDDFGLKPLSPTQSDDFYEVISERYMKGSTILTSNRSVEDWQVLFPEPIMANSVMDRIAHNAHQIIMTGESYRTKGKITLKRQGEEKKSE